MADTPAAAQEAVEAVVVDYRDLDPVVAEYEAKLDRVATQWAADGTIASTYDDLPFTQRFARILNDAGNPGYRPFDICLGGPFRADEPLDASMHAGPAVAGVIGLKKFIYDVWGDTVNTASRMERHCEPMQINLSEQTRALLDGRFAVTARGPIEVKGTTFNSIMPAPAPALSDQDIADVLSFVRSEWGNDAPPVTVEAVTAIRAQGPRAAPWTWAELEKL